MKKMLFLVFGVMVLVFPGAVWAHPGRTAADGCHYCRTNCDKWGVAWDERHCHGGGSAVPAVSVPIPAPVVEESVIKVPTPVERETLKETEEVRVDPVVEKKVESAPTKETKNTDNVVKSSTKNDESGGGGVAAVVLLGGGAYLYSKFKGKK